MPSFGIGINPYRQNNGSVRGNTYPIACMAWYAPDRAPVPLMLKFEGHDGTIETVSGIKVISTASKNYDGSGVYEYACEAVIGGIRYVFKLIFYVMSCKWVMVLQQ
jgi:hypothetical protein